jgi:pimeloyl-ACP methyl ester carboxylesterase
MSFANNQGVRIHYEVEGQGPPLVLHHGFGQSLATWTWNGYVEALKQAYRLILIDSRGQGASDKPHDPDAYGLKQRATDVVSVLDALGVEQAHYFGYTQGGWVGFGLARYAPERVRSLFIGGAHPYGQSMAIYREMLKDGLEAGLARLEGALGLSLPEVVRAHFLKNDLQALRAAYRNDRPDISEFISGMTIPAFLFAGEADPLYPAVQRCAAELPNATFLGLPGLNHHQAGIRTGELLPYLMQFLADVERHLTKTTLPRI